MLLVTGVHLWFEYRPAASDGWDDLYTSSTGVSLAHTSRVVHRWVSQSAVLTGIVAAVLAIATVIEERLGNRLRLLPGPALALAVLSASFTGFLLPWDQLALWAVTVGTNVRGLGDAMDGEKVRFVLIGGTEVSVTTYARWSWTHAAVIPVVVAALGATTWRVLRRPVRIPPEEGEQPVLR